MKKIKKRDKKKSPKKSPKKNPKNFSCHFRVITCFLTLFPTLFEKMVSSSDEESTVSDNRMVIGQIEPTSAVIRSPESVGATGYSAIVDPQGQVYVEVPGFQPMPEGTVFTVCFFLVIGNVASVCESRAFHASTRSVEKMKKWAEKRTLKLNLLYKQAKGNHVNVYCRVGGVCFINNDLPFRMDRETIE